MTSADIFAPYRHRRYGMLLSKDVSIAILLINEYIFTTAELQWLEHLWSHENVFETRVVQAYDC